jgi:hypothetical protein
MHGPGQQFPRPRVHGPGPASTVRACKARRDQGGAAAVHPRTRPAQKPPCINGPTQKPPMTVAMVQVGKLDLAFYLHTQIHTILMIKDGDWGKAIYVSSKARIED